MPGSHRSRTAEAVRLVALSGAAVLVVSATWVAPAASADTPLPTPVLSAVALPTTWSALGTGTLASPDLSAGTGALAGTEIKAQIGTIDFSGTPGPGTYATTWLSCPTRGAAESGCLRTDSPATSGNPSGQVRGYIPKADEVGRYMRFRLSVVPAGGTARTVTSDPAKDVYVVGPPALGAQPEVRSGQIPGEPGIALLKKWTIPPSCSFRSREVAVWACTQGTAGQSASKDFTPSAAGCTALPVLTAVAWVTDPTAIVFEIPADAAGKVLLVSDSVTTATGPSLALATYVVRSNAAALKGTLSAPAPVTSASPAASPAASPSSNAQVGQSTTTATMSVVAARRATPGERYSVAVTVNPPSSSGIANVRLVTRDAQASTVQTLSSVQVSNGSGTSLSTITATPGRYALIVQFVESRTGSSLTFTRKMRIRQ